MDSALSKQLFALNSEVSNTILRRHQWALHGEVCHSNVLSYHFVNRVVAVWNALPNYIVDSFFKKRLKTYLMKNSQTNPFKV